MSTIKERQHDIPNPLGEMSNPCCCGRSVHAEGGEAAASRAREADGAVGEGDGDAPEGQERGVLAIGPGRETPVVGQLPPVVSVPLSGPTGRDCSKMVADGGHQSR